jgi:FkbM family methyltransferase
MGLIGKLRKVWDQGFKEQSFSLDELDRKLKPYLDFKNGFFIEAGANDGVTYSNTLYYERYRNWNGLLIEPIPELAKLCKANRPRCIVENCALVSSDYSEREVSMYCCRMMSLVKGAMKSTEADLEHVRKGREVQGVQSYEVKVPARTLTSILEQHGIGKIDFLSLDVEGYELNALKGLDFGRYRPRFMLIEARFREEIDAFLRPNYEPVTTLSHHDVLYCERGA